MSAFGGRADSFAHSELSRFCCDAGHRSNRALRPICTRHRLNPETCHASPDVETSRASFSDLLHRSVGLLLHRGRIGLCVMLQRCQAQIGRSNLNAAGHDPKCLWSWHRIPAGCLGTLRRSHSVASDGSFHLSVRDTGPGISATDQARLFQEFQQADNAITARRAAPAWDLRYQSASSRCTAAKSGSSLARGGSGLCPCVHELQG